VDFSVKREPDRGHFEGTVVREVKRGPLQQATSGGEKEGLKKIEGVDRRKVGEVAGREEGSSRNVLRHKKGHDLNAGEVKLTGSVGRGRPENPT